MKKFDMGFSREAIAVMNLPISDKNKIEALANELSSHSAFKHVSASALPGIGCNIWHKRELYRL